MKEKTEKGNLLPLWSSAGGNGKQRSHTTTTDVPLPSEKSKPQQTVYTTYTRIV